MKVKEVAEFLKVTTEELLKLLKNVSVGKSYTEDSEIEKDLEKYETVIDTRGDTYRKLVSHSIEDVENEVQDKTVMQSGRYSLTKTLENKMKQKIKDDCENVFAKMIESRADIIDIYSMFNKYNHTEFQQFLSSLNQDEFYLSKVKLIVNSSVST